MSPYPCPRPDSHYEVKLDGCDSDALIVGNSDETSTSKVRHLRLLSCEPENADGPQLLQEVRAARRDMARLLRALQASGQSVASWSPVLVTRLAHVDALTARYLIEGRSGEERAIRRATEGMRAIEQWVVDGLRGSLRAEVRAFELLIRVEDSALSHPLLQPHGSPEEQTPAIDLQSGLRLCSLSAGLRALEEPSLLALGRRLGIRTFESGSDADPIGRGLLVERIASRLRDDELLAILVATLGVEAQELLGGLVRGQLTPDEQRRLARPVRLLAAVGADYAEASAPIDALRSCGLVFDHGSADAEAVWVPVELQPRIDGVLRAFGL